MDKECHAKDCICNQPKTTPFDRLKELLKGDQLLDFCCTRCQVGINCNEELFLISKNKIEVFCPSCQKELRVCLNIFLK